VNDPWPNRYRLFRLRSRSVYILSWDRWWIWVVSFSWNHMYVFMSMIYVCICSIKYLYGLKWRLKPIQWPASDQNNPVNIHVHVCRTCNSRKQTAHQKYEFYRLAQYVNVTYRAVECRNVIIIPAASCSCKNARKGIMWNTKLSMRWSRPGRQLRSRGRQGHVVRALNSWHVNSPVFVSHTA
jgi:hypothetical protein